MRIYLDSNVWIYLYESTAVEGELARSLLKQAERGGHTILASHHVLAELLVVPVRFADAFTIASYRRAILSSEIVQVIPFSTDAAMRFAALRATTRTKPVDSVHLALAASVGADFFVTNDNRLEKLTVPGIGCIAQLDVTLS